MRAHVCGGGQREREGEITSRGDELGLDRQGPAVPWAAEEAGLAWLLGSLLSLTLKKIKTKQR